MFKLVWDSVTYTCNPTPKQCSSSTCTWLVRKCWETLWTTNICVHVYIKVYKQTYIHTYIHTVYIYICIYICHLTDLASSVCGLLHISITDVQCYMHIYRCRQYTYPPTYLPAYTYHLPTYGYMQTCTHTHTCTYVRTTGRQKDRQTLLYRHAYIQT